MATSSPSHRMRFFILGIDVLFTIGDKIVRIVHSGEKSKVLVWLLGKNTDGRCFWNFEHNKRISMNIISYLLDHL
jgi:hypothetical protein